VAPPQATVIAATSRMAPVAFMARP
jgi:hypothetical protein